MKVSEILSKAADLIEPEGAWHRGWFAADHNGSLVWSDNERACRWCAAGALSRASGKKLKNLREAQQILVRIIGNEIIGNWNDAPERTQAEVVAALRQAASLAKEQESANG